jgi:EXLDI family protein
MEEKNTKTNIEEADEFELKRTDTKNLSFKGWKLSSSSTWREGDSRWMEFALYKTTGGRFVVHASRMTAWQGERDFYEAFVAKTIPDVLQKVADDYFSGEMSDALKDLVSDLDVDLTEHIK